ncbi:MAG: EamA family transporter [Gulosibacter sp.]|uniref:EamA family transporter n=1 Tax=Gulosibacter sp. TaxID=2817531 RepID=UPI003F8F5E83
MSRSSQSSQVPGTLLTIGAQFSSQTDAALAVTLFALAGPIGTVSLRLGFSAIILLLVFRPNLKKVTRKGWLAILAFGTSMGLMNSSMFLALDRLPLGTAVTLELLGPLMLAVVLAKRAIAWLWSGVALIGVLFLTGVDAAQTDLLGVVFALFAAAMWASYIVTSARTSLLVQKSDGLALAVTVSALIVVPFGAITAGDALLRTDVLLWGLLIALMSTAIPYTLEFFALRLIPRETFAILLSLAPVIATLSGFVVLGQVLTLFDLVGVGFVVVACAGALRMRAQPDTKS